MLATGNITLIDNKSAAAICSARHVVVHLHENVNVLADKRLLRDTYSLLLSIIVNFSTLLRTVHSSDSVTLSICHSHHLYDPMWSLAWYPAGYNVKCGGAQENRISVSSCLEIIPLYLFPRWSSLFILFDLVRSSVNGAVLNLFSANLFNSCFVHPSKRLVDYWEKKPSLDFLCALKWYTQISLLGPADSSNSSLSVSWLKLPLYHFSSSTRFLFPLLSTSFFRRDVESLKSSQRKSYIHQSP